MGAERFIPAVCIAASLLGAGFVFMGGSFGYTPERQVTLETQGLSDNYFTSARTVSDFLEEIDIRISEFDSVHPAPGAPIRPGMVITYSRAKRVMIADAGIEPFEVMCAGRTVCDLLTQEGLGIRPLDRVVPPPETVLESGMEVNITRVEVLDFTVEREIEPELVIEPDPDLPRGHMEEVNPGAPGLAEDTTRIFIRNGEETARVDIGSRVLSEPQDRIARVGVRSAPPLASRSGVHRDVLEMDATGYDPGPLSCAPYADGRTATGHIAGFGVCAVDPNVIPLGTEVWVEGYGYALACDTGGAIRGNRIDMCFNTRSEALRWGRRNVLVYILD
jgi:3D (Asp-Asp-Asp) domain-containing protein